MNHFPEDILLGPAEGRLRELADGSQKALPAIPPAVSEESVLNRMIFATVAIVSIILHVFFSFSPTRDSFLFYSISRWFMKQLEILICILY